MRFVFAVLFTLFALASPLHAQDVSRPGAAAEPVWQQTVSGQIEAFRTGDGATALLLAGASFKSTFSDPDQFYAAIVASGYGPLVLSRSHSFGSFEQLDDGTVLQLVDLVGPDGKLYQAVYQMREEAEGWRVQGVTMQQQQGVSI